MQIRSQSIHSLSRTPRKKRVHVTRPVLPALDEFLPYLKEIWGNGVLTNNGRFHRELETRLADYLGVKYISLFSNGTIALILALRALRISGEVITTPYSFVATAHALMWNGIRPVFVDIDPNSFNIDPKLIEKAINGKTAAVMPVHCYGQPCDIESIKAISDKYGLPIIYDAAHAFGANYKGVSLLAHGDLSVLSFHATKIFNTFEGGAIVSQTQEMKNRIDSLKNFGFKDEVTVSAVGINGKMSEICAAMGLAQLKNFSVVLGRHREIARRYVSFLSNVPGIHLPPNTKNPEANNSYFPILISEAYPLSRDELYAAFRDNNIMARRYFYPLISDFPDYNSLPSTERSGLPNAAYVADRVLCLPIYSTLLDEEIDYICDFIKTLAPKSAL